MSGKDKCKILKEIRQKIAQDNDITLITTECRHQGDCRGTCPKCEAELAYLERELDKRQQLGKRIAVAGIAAALVVTASGCELFKEPEPLTGDVAYIEDGELPGAAPYELPTETIPMLRHE